MPSVLLVDDKEELLRELESALTPPLREEGIAVKTWIPAEDKREPLATFESLIDSQTMLVVTDYDLTGQGMTGLFGSSIVSWCQARAIPVGDFSRGIDANLPKVPNLFELRIPSDTDQATDFIVSLCRGFRGIYNALNDRKDILKRMKSPAGVLASILGAPADESQFSLYGMRIGIVNPILINKILQNDSEPTLDEKNNLLGYIVGHLLLNAVLRYPGPIASERALLAYVGVGISESEDIKKVFSDAMYTGPFSETGCFFWLSKVDEMLDEFSKGVPSDFSAETSGGLYRGILELKLARPLARPECERCKGENGGFLCPFTKKTVCQRPDCSVSSSSWIPQGAKLCRVDRDFYEEWSPILGN